MSKAKFYCEECHNPVAVDAEFCTHCGKKFEGVRCPSCGYSGHEFEFMNGCPVCGYLSVNQAMSSKGTKSSSGSKKEAAWSQDPLTDYTGDISLMTEQSTGYGEGKKKKKRYFLSEGIYKLVILVLSLLLFILLFFLFRS